MKKLILIIICSLFCSNVNAATYYSEYTPFISGVEQVMEESDTLKSEEVKLYNTFYEKKVPTIITNDKSKCSNHYKDIYYDEIVSKSKEKKSDYDLLYGAINYQNYYATEMKFQFKADAKIKSIYITDKNGNYISYDIKSSSIFNHELLKDVNNQEEVHIKMGNTFVIDVDNLYINDLIIHMISDDAVHTNFRFKATDNKYYMADVRCNHFDFLPYNEYKALRDEFGKIPGSYNLDGYYKNVKRSYLCYKVEKIKTDNYQNKSKDSIIDDYKTLYNYYKRDKVIIDEITITDEFFNLKDLIKYSTIELDKIKINNNINYKKSGNYNIEIIMNDNFIINHKVKFELLKPIEVEEKKDKEIIYLTKEKKVTIPIYKESIKEKIVYKNKNNNIIIYILLTLILLLILLLVIRKIRRK